MKHFMYDELKGTYLFICSTFLNFFAVMDKTTVTFILGAISSVCVIVYYAIKIYYSIKHKKDVG